MSNFFFSTRTSLSSEFCFVCILVIGKWNYQKGLTVLVTPDRTSVLRKNPKCLWLNSSLKRQPTDSYVGHFTRTPRYNGNLVCSNSGQTGPRYEHTFRQVSRWDGIPRQFCQSTQDPTGQIGTPPTWNVPRPPSVLPPDRGETLYYTDLIVSLL